MLVEGADVSAHDAGLCDAAATAYMTGTVGEDGMLHVTAFAMKGMGAGGDAPDGGESPDGDGEGGDDGGGESPDGDGGSGMGDG